MVVERLEGPAEAAVAYLAAAGVGTIVVRDEGRVAAPGFLFEIEDVGRPRVEAARDRIARMNPDATVAAAGDGVPLPACADLPAAAEAALAAVRTLLAGR